MVETTAIPRKHPACSFRVIDGQAVIANTETAEVQILNEVGSYVWSLVDGRRTLDELVPLVRAQLVEAKYESIPADLTADIAEFLADIAARGMIEFLPEPR